METITDRFIDHNTIEEGSVTDQATDILNSRTLSFGSISRDSNVAYAAEHFDVFNETSSQFQARTSSGIAALGFAPRESLVGGPIPDIGVVSDRAEEYPALLQTLSRDTVIPPLDTLMLGL